MRGRVTIEQAMRLLAECTAGPGMVVFYDWEVCAAKKKLQQFYK